MPKTFAYHTSTTVRWEFFHCCHGCYIHRWASQEHALKLSIERDKFFLFRCFFFPQLHMSVYHVTDHDKIICVFWHRYAMYCQCAHDAYNNRFVAYQSFFFLFSFWKPPISPSFSPFWFLFVVAVFFIKRKTNIIIIL